MRVRNIRQQETVKLELLESVKMQEQSELSMHIMVICQHTWGGARLEQDWDQKMSGLSEVGVVLLCFSSTTFEVPLKKTLNIYGSCGAFHWPVKKKDKVEWRSLQWLNKWGHIVENKGTAASQDNKKSVNEWCVWFSVECFVIERDPALQNKKMVSCQSPSVHTYSM